MHIIQISAFILADANNLSIGITMIPQERVNIIKVNVDTLAELVRNKVDEAFSTVLSDKQTVQKLGDLISSKVSSVLADTLSLKLTTKTCQALENK